MMKRILSVGAILCFALTGMAQMKRTTLVAQINGYKYDMIYFGSMLNRVGSESFRLH